MRLTEVGTLSRYCRSCLEEIRNYSGSPRLCRSCADKEKERLLQDTEIKRSMWQGRIKPKDCARCGKSITHRQRNSVYCKYCQRIVRLEKMRGYVQDYQERKKRVL
jgi:hypothetical protein